jgi:CheY-like chemotaxis protein
MSSPAGFAAGELRMVRITTDFAVRVLLVDDDPLVLEVLSVVLAESGFACRTALNGYEALRILLEAPFDIVVSDLRMPKLSGFELLGIIRKHFPESAVIVISSEVDAVSQIASSLMDAFFRKGAFTHEQLIKVIRRLAKQYRNRLTRGTNQPLRIARPGGQQIEIDTYGALARESQRGRGKREQAENKPRFTIQDDECAGFRVRGIYDPWEQAWRIKTWPIVGDRPEHDYWVRGVDFYTVRAQMETNGKLWRRSDIGGEDNRIAPKERKAVLYLIGKWDSVAQRSA